MKFQYWFIGAVLVLLHFSSTAFSQVTPERFWKVDQAYGHKEIGSFVQVADNYTWKLTDKDSVFSQISDSLGIENFLDSVALIPQSDTTLADFYFYSGGSTFGPFEVKIREVTTHISQSGDTLYYTNEKGGVQSYLPDFDTDSLITISQFDSTINSIHSRIDTFYTQSHIDSLISEKADTATINQIIADIDSCCSANGIDSMWVDPDFGSPGESVIIIEYFDGSQDIFNINEVYESGKITSINFVNDTTVQFVQNSGNNNTSISWNINGLQNVIEMYSVSEMDTVQLDTSRDLLSTDDNKLLFNSDTNTYVMRIDSLEWMQRKQTEIKFESYNTGNIEIDGSDVTLKDIDGNVLTTSVVIRSGLLRYIGDNEYLLSATDEDEPETLESPDGSLWQIQVDNSGNLSTISIP